MFLKNKNIIFKIRRSKVTDYAALTLRVFRLGHKCFLLGSFTCTGLLRCAKYLSKHVHGLPDLPHSDYPFKFLDNLFLKIPVQWLVIFLKFFYQISETFGMSTVD